MTPASTRRLGPLLVAAVLLSGCVGRAEGTRLFELDVGDCFNDRLVSADDDRLILRVELVPCGDPHQKEVTGIVPVEGDDDYPGGHVFVDVVSAECDTALTDYARGPSDQLASTGHYPSPNSWNLGYRWVICVARAADGGDLRGSVGDPATPAGQGFESP